MEAERTAETYNAPPYDQWASTSKNNMVDNQEDRTSHNAMDLDRIMSSPGSENRGTPTLFSMDDLEVAKALTGLREASPAQSTTTITSQSFQSQSPSQTQPEPLLTLLTSQHPLLSAAVHNSVSAYTSTKGYSPHFRRGAEFVERNIASPVANTVGTAGRLSGVETGVRWWLQRRESQGEETHTGHKRQRLEDDAMDVERGLAYRSRATSDISQPEYLPPYDTNRSPVYEEYALNNQKQGQPEQAPALHNWQTRFAISTSGLGVAMSEESLRSLKYCLSWLRWANTHLNSVLASLQSVLLEWERSQSPSTPTSPDDNPISPSNTNFPTISDRTSDRPPRDPAVITSHLAALKAETVKTLKNALDVVSTYAGGALPENARNLVKKHLTSLPLRFKIAQGTSTTDNSASSNIEAQNNTPEVVSGAQRVVVLAREGLDMMSQVSGVVDGTIVSAEDWCERLGRKKPRQGAGPDNREAIEMSKNLTEQVEKVDTIMTNGDKSH